MFRSFLFDFVHQLSSTALLSLSEPCSAAKFSKISLVKSPDFPSVGSLYLSLIYVFVMFAFVYDDDLINYVVTVLTSRIEKIAKFNTLQF